MMSSSHDFIYKLLEPGIYPVNARSVAHLHEAEEVHLADRGLGTWRCNNVADFLEQRCPSLRLMNLSGNRLHALADLRVPSSVTELRVANNPMRDLPVRGKWQGRVTIDSTGHVPINAASARWPSPQGTASRYGVAVQWLVSAFTTAALADVFLPDAYRGALFGVLMGQTISHRPTAFLVSACLAPLGYMWKPQDHSVAAYIPLLCAIPLGLQRLNVSQATPEACPRRPDAPLNPDWREEPHEFTSSGEVP